MAIRQGLLRRDASKNVVDDSLVAQIVYGHSEGPKTHRGGRSGGIYNPITPQTMPRQRSGFRWMLSGFLLPLPSVMTWASRCMAALSAAVKYGQWASAAPHTDLAVHRFWVAATTWSAQKTPGSRHLNNGGMERDAKPAIASGCDPIPFRTWKSNLMPPSCY